jgi:hypothetical protein
VSDRLKVEAKEEMQHFIVFAYAVAIGIETGAGLFTSMAVFPVWTASPEIVIGWQRTMPYFVEEGRFFMFGSTTTTLLALAVLLTQKRLPAPARPWALGSGLTFLAVAVWTAAYFIPVQGRMHGDAGAALPREQLAAMLEHFVALNWIRQALLLAAFVAAVRALGVFYRNERPSS